MMYLSRIEVNIRRRATMLALASPQIIHAALEAGFPREPGKSDDDARGILWRTDQLDGSLYILVQSIRRPDFTHLVEQFGWPASGQRWETREYGTFLASLANDQRWRFRLRANPVHRVGGLKEAGKRGEVRAHVTAEQQRRWLDDRSSRLGFMIHDMDVVHRETVRFRRKERWITLSRVTFEGLLSVVDAAGMAETMRTGIGRGKAYGCGLLTIAGI